MNWLWGRSSQQAVPEERKGREGEEARKEAQYNRPLPPEQQVDQQPGKNNSDRRVAFLGAPQELLSLLTMVGLLLYGVSILGYRAFYGTLGIDPEEVGLGYSLIVTQAALGVLLFTLPLVILSILGTDFQQSFSSAENRFLWLFGITSAVIVALSFHGSIGISVIALIALIILIAVTIICTRKAASNLLMGFAILTCLASLIAMPIVIGTALANEIRSGETETAISTIGLLRIRVRTVKALWSQSAPSWANTSGLYFYLGEADGIVILYDTEADAIYRIPADSVSLQTTLQ